MPGRKERIISALNSRRRQVRKIAKGRRDEAARAQKEMLAAAGLPTAGRPLAR